MNFRTLVELPEKEVKISHSERIMLWGSCFVENIGKLMTENKFRCNVNPLGILYNPISIAESLRQVLEGKVYEETDLFQSSGMWHSWMHHSDFSSNSSKECLKRINDGILTVAESLSKTDWLVVTWGTAYVYYLKQGGMIVGNCHKQPEKLFTRKRLETNEIVEAWKCLFDDLRVLNPRLKVLFTISPIRHAKDGMHGNQLSKSVLLLAVDELCRTCSDCFYFPSYEILMDELRDYRFYADDMLHPSAKAVEYIWKCFCQCYFNKETREIMNEWESINKALEHKPFNPDSEAYRKFLSQIVLKIAQIKEKFPYLEVQKDLELCESRLKI
ncbi:MAG: GSCFA domain-containing protein [Bacteroidaceae bacterium]|nr:GSCFA domain-containing protein [Bacteroidaceae bacterium]